MNRGKNRGGRGGAVMAVWVMLVALAASVLPAAPAKADAGVWAAVAPSVPWIDTDLANASGVVVERDGKRLVLTAYHAVQDASMVRCFFPEYRDGELITDRDYYLGRAEELAHPAQVIDIDPRRDLALLEVEAIPDTARPLPIAEVVLPGEDIHVVGHSGATPLFSYTQGHIRGVHTPSAGPVAAVHGVFKPLSDPDAENRPIQGRYLIVTSPINEGDSGAPAVLRSADGALAIAGLCQSYSDGRLISNLVHAAELRDFLAGGNQTVDRRVQDILDAQGLTYEIDDEGCFAVEVGEQTMFVESRTHGRAAERRDVWAPLAAVVGEFPSEFTQALLEGNAELSYGRFEVRRRGELRMAAYSLNVPAAATAAELVEALETASKAASEAAERLPLPLDFATPDPADDFAVPDSAEDATGNGDASGGEAEDAVEPSLQGRWKAVFSDGFAFFTFEEETCRLDLNGDTLSGAYTYTEGVLTVRLNDRVLLEGRVEFDADGDFYLIDSSDSRILFLGAE